MPADKNPSTVSGTNLSPDMQRAMLREMLLIRRFEERASVEYDAGNIYGGLHCYNGEEAVAVGVCSNLTPQDQIISTHRGHGHCIAKGADVKRMFAELYGRTTGYCKGKGGSMHIADFDVGMLGANGIVAGGISIITGAGLAAKLDGKGAVAVSFFGDGASNAGPFHECLNIAALWKLPMIYVCENNGYATTAPISTTHALPDVSLRATGYGMPSVIVDGNDAIAVHQATRVAVERARAGNGPTLIECKVNRWRAHTEKKSMPDTRPKELIESYFNFDPIQILANRLKEQGEMDDAQLKAVEADVLREIEEAVAFAAASPFPLPEQALEDVYEL